MKKILLLGVAAIGLLLAQPARADLPVIDATAIGDLLEQIGIEGDQLTQLVNVYTETVQVYNMATNIWNSVAELVGADQWAPGLTDPTIRNPLPYMAATHPGYVGGFNDPSGLPFGSQFIGQNTVGGNPQAYNDGSFAGGEILKAIQSYSAMQAVATNHLQAIETRITALGDLFAQLANIGTIQETDSLSARLHNELNYASSQVIQGQQAMSTAIVQHYVLENNQTQWQYADETNGIAATCANVASAGGAVTVPACSMASASPLLGGAVGSFLVPGASASSAGGDFSSSTGTTTAGPAGGDFTSAN